MKHEYDLICIGLGPAGMAVSIMASEMGLKVCAIEKNKIGGECMNCGCIPSKAILRMAQFRKDVENLPLFQMEKLPTTQPLSTLFENIQSDLKYINEKKTLKMFDKVDLVLGKGFAEFVDSNTVKVADKTYTANKIFIAAGTKPTLLNVPGIDSLGEMLLTNENLFKLDAVPQSMIVQGGGAIACEMAQAFARLGTEVTMIQRSKNILSKQDSQAATILEKSLREDGIKLYTGQTIQKIENLGDKLQITTSTNQTFQAQKLLAASGRAYDFSSMKLENSNIKINQHGAIIVDKKLRTSQKNIYAVGDCNGHYLFSHAAMHQGMIALINSMMPVKMNFKKFVVPATIFTEPQVSYVGLTETQLKQKGIKYKTITAKYEDYGAAIAEKIPQGFVKVFCSSLGKIYGVVIVGHGSGEMINEWALAIQKKVRMHEIMMLQHSFPTMGFLSKRVSEMWMMEKMKSTKLQKMCQIFFRKSLS